jgi:hypothetical protein
MNTFKIQRRFKLESILEFITWIMLRIWSRPNWESCSKYSKLAPCKVSVFLEQGKPYILNFKLWRFWNKRKENFKLSRAHLSVGLCLSTLAWRCPDRASTPVPTVPPSLIGRRPTWVDDLIPWVDVEGRSPLCFSLPPSLTCLSAECHFLFSIRFIQI